MKAVILAAGESSRFRPLSDKRHKGLTQILGKSIIEHTIEELRNAGVNEVIVVQGPDKEIEKQISGVDHYVVQEKPKGMGNALKQAEHLLNGEFLVLTPYRANASKYFEDLMEKAEKDDAETVFVSAETNEPEKYGILEFKDGKAVNIVEKPDPNEAPSNMKVVGMYLLDNSFFQYLDSVEEWEYQYEDALAEKMNDEPATVLRIDEETNSIKYPWDLFSVVEELMKKRNRNISSKAEIADSAKIKGKVIIENDVRIHENAVIKGPVYVGENTVIGNNALVRDNVSLEKNTTVGANTEIKNSIMQKDSSIHSGFIGDSIIGRDTHIGAGTVTANRNFRENGERPLIKSDLIAKDYSKQTNKTFLGCFVGDNVDIGVNVSIMPGVQIGSDSHIGPGTIVTDNVGNNSLVYVDQEKVKKEN